MLTHLIQSFGYAGVFVLMTLESVFIPIPSEVTMPFAGYLASQGSMNLWIAISMGALGNLVGSLIGYYTGYLLKEETLVRWIRRYGKYVLVRESDYRMSARWFAKYGSPAVFFSRLLPAVRTYISLPAGMFRMNIWKFSAYTLVGSFLWSALLAWIGYVLGSQWDSAKGLLKPLEYLVIVIVALTVAYWLYRRRQDTSAGS